MKVHLMIPNMSGRTGSRACPVSSGVCGLGSAVLVPSVFLHSVLTGTRLCWGGWKSSALSFWTPITTPLTSSSHTCQVSPPCASTRTRSTTCLCLWRRSGESFRASGESIVSSCSCITKPSCPSYNSSGFLPFMVEGSSAWWTTRQHPVILTEGAWHSTSTTGENGTALKQSLQVWTLTQEGWDTAAPHPTILFFNFLTSLFTSAKKWNQNVLDQLLLQRAQLYGSEHSLVLLSVSAGSSEPVGILRDLEV